MNDVLGLSISHELDDDEVAGAQPERRLGIFRDEYTVDRGADLKHVTGTQLRIDLHASCNFSRQFSLRRRCFLHPSKR